MHWNRRTFLKTTTLTGAALGLGLVPACGGEAETMRIRGAYRAEAADRRLKLLILGGTAFLGPATVEAALARGHEITLFNRGRTNPHLFPELEKLVGDRKDDLAALRDRQWDVVIDTSGYVPRHVAMSAELLAPGVGHYVFVSTCSVYADFDTVGLDETSPVATLDDPTTEEVTATTYGGLKALCEQAAEAAMPGRVTSVRPGLIVGPRDRSDRFTYWPVRIERGGEVLAPEGPEVFTQFIDVRDVAEFLVVCCERRQSGVFNADAPASTLTLGGMMDTCRDVTGVRADLTWVDPAFLAEHEVAPWSDLPCWMPRSEEVGFGTIRTEKARSAGLGMRPLPVTVADTLTWWHEQPADRRQNLRSGLAPAREAEVLAAWHARG